MDNRVALLSPLREAWMNTRPNPVSFTFGTLLSDKRDPNIGKTCSKGKICRSLLLPWDAQPMSFVLVEVYFGDDAPISITTGSSGLPVAANRCFPARML